MNTPRPALVYKLWCDGIADEQAAADTSYPMSATRRWFIKLRGGIVSALFGWWWYD